MSARGMDTIGLDGAKKKHKGRGYRRNVPSHQLVFLSELCAGWF